MDSTYNSYFFNEFYAENGGGNYMDKDKWMPFFEGVATKIVERFNPTTVLDAGCATGYLVEALRNKGVEAYGFDISKYAISRVDYSIKPYCIVHSITDPLPDNFPKSFDLVVTIEVLEHLYPDEGRKAIANLCRYSDNIIFTSTPDDFDDVTHVNVQPSDYWVRLFAEYEFYRDLIQPIDFVCPWAMLFIKKDNFSKVIGEYEINLRILNSRIQQIQKEYRDSSYTSTLFLDYGDGFSKGDNITINSSNFEFYKEYEIKPTTKLLRFDPVDGKGCIVHNLDIISNNGQLKALNKNGIKIDNFNIFTSTDPQLFIDLENKPTLWIKIKATIIPFESMAMYTLLSKFYRFKKKNQEIVTELEEKVTENSLVLEEKEALLAEIEAKEAEIVELFKIKEAKEVMLAVAEAKEVEILEILEKKEEELALAQETIEERFLKLESKDKTINAFDEKCKKLESELEHYKTHYMAAINQREDLIRQLAEVNGAYKLISNSTSWRITKPLRAIMDLLKKLLKSNRFTHNFCKGIKSLKQHGVKYIWGKVKSKLSTKYRMKEYYQTNILSEEEKEYQKNTVFNKDIKFSILVPLYNTPEKYLIEMVESVIAQTYDNWELCLADGSDEEHSYVQKICNKYSKNDNRILYQKLDKNEGISGNTNKCIEMGTGDYLALLDHDDLLHPSALYENMKAICEKKADFIYTDENTFSEHPSDAYCPHFKPDFAPDTLRSYNYICHLSVFSKELLDKAGCFRSEFDGSQDYDMILRLTEKAKTIVHIPKILYYWRAHQGSVASNVSVKPYTIIAAKKALSDHLKRNNLSGEVVDSLVPSTYKINYKIFNEPLISILIPNMDHIKDLGKCINSIIKKSTYQNYEIIIIENNSRQDKTFEFYKSLQYNDRITVIEWDGEFNYSAINNYGLRYVKGDYIILLNNDIEIITPNWIQEMLMFAQRNNVGAVGAKLYYSDNTVQHAGVILGIGGVAGHSHKYFNRSDTGYMMRLSIAQNLSAVTGACMMIKRSVFEAINGFDESFKVAFNDVDLCMRIRKAGYLIVFTPYAELYHYESKSRGLENTPEKQKRFQGEVLRFQERWEKELEAGDPYYNPNLTLVKEDFSVK